MQYGLYPGGLPSLNRKYKDFPFGINNRGFRTGLA